MRLLRLLLGLALLSLLPAKASNYNFGYSVEGSPQELRPIQVFDDGVRTYFSMASAIVPTVVAKLGTSEVLVGMKRSGPYLVAPLLAPTFELRYGSQFVTVVGPPVSATQLPATQSMMPLEDVAPSLGMRATQAKVPPAFGPVMPRRGDDSGVDFIESETLISFGAGSTVLNKEAAAKIAFALSSTSDVAQVRIVGRDTAEYLEGAARARAHVIRDRVISLGIPPNRVLTTESFARDGAAAQFTADLVVVRRVPRRQHVDEKPLASERPVQRTFDLRISDGDLKTAMARWAKGEGYALHWDAKAVIQLTSDHVVTATGFLDAVDQVVLGARSFGYRITPIAYPNRVLQVVDQIEEGVSR
jgi:hypothetical protein